MAFGYCFSALFLVPKYAATWLSASAAEIGQIQSAPVVVAIFAAPICGRWLDRGGWRPAMISGAVVASLSTVAFGAVRELGPLVFLLRGLQGLGNTLFLGGTAALVTRLVAREHHTRAFGTVGAAALLMNAAASSATEHLAEVRGWNTAFEVAGLMGLVALAITRGLPRLTEVAAAGHQAPATPGHWTAQRAVDYGAAAAGVGFGLIATFTQPFALSLGANHVSLLFVGYTVTALFVRLALANFADRFGRRRSAVLALGVYALAALAASELRPGWLLELGFLFGLGHGLAWPALNALAVQYAPPERIGSALTRIQALFGVGGFCAVWGGGALVERLGYAQAFVIGSAAVASGALALFLAGASAKGER
ncbi:MAG TPA: MFS transporter [Polyangiaceae bacterium]